MLFFLILYFSLAILALIIIWMALNAAQQSDRKGIHPFENYERNIHAKTYPRYQ
jgi:hypothetical protein